MRFKVGDKIIMNSQANVYYTLTKEGFIGEVVAVFLDSNELRVRFDGLEKAGYGGTYLISPITCELYVEPRHLKFDKVIRKIKELDSRFERRQQEKVLEEAYQMARAGEAVPLTQEALADILRRGYAVPF